jgi:GrpB-like predicted nucleotidyltransferase (UPF0157 family)
MKARLASYRQKGRHRDRSSGSIVPTNDAELERNKICLAPVYSRNLQLLFYHMFQEYVVLTREGQSAMPSLTYDENCWSNAKEDVIEVAAYDNRWPHLFQAEKAQLEIVLPSVIAVQIEHIGSTAVPGLAAKPIIDIALINDDESFWPQLIAPITSLGYIFWMDNPRQDRLFFVKGMPPYGTRRSHHIHVRHSWDIQAERKFRDYLIDNPPIAKEYENLKQTLAIQFREDREAYTEGKTEFINGILQK